MSRMTLSTILATPINPRAPLKEGETLPVLLEQEVTDRALRRTPGPHPCGRAEVLADGRLAITLIDTDASRHAAAMLNDDLLDVVLWNGTVRLRVIDGAR